MKKEYQEILEKLSHGEAVTLETVIKGRKGSIKEDIHRSLKEMIPVRNAKGKLCYQVEEISDGEDTMIREPITPPERLIIFGGGHISLPLSQFAVSCGFSVYVVDDREAFANRERFSHVEGVICDSFENAVQQLKITAYDYIVIVTRGHAHDGDCLRAILPGVQPAYLGMIGSRRRVQAQFIMLAKEGYSKEKLDQIYTPIGLNIGGVTPAEIAIAIMAEIISCKRLGTRGQVPVSLPSETGTCPLSFVSNESDLEIHVLKALAVLNEPAALVTLIESKGSTPRKAGAKMIVFPDGTIVGTIGGGLSEGLSIQEARQLIGTGFYKMVDFDLSGSVAASDGMACGGSSRVLIEDICSDLDEQDDVSVLFKRL